MGKRDPGGRFAEVLERGSGLCDLFAEPDRVEGVESGRVNGVGRKLRTRGEGHVAPVHLWEDGVVDVRTK